MSGIKEVTEEVKAAAGKAEKAVKTRAKKAADNAAAAEVEVKKTTRAASRKVKEAAAEAKVVAEDVKEAATAAEIATKKTVRKTTRKVKEAVDAGNAAAEKKTRKAKAAKVEIIVQSPMGGNITAEEIAAKIPEGCDSVFVRVDQNKLWWIKGEETGSVDIWD